MPNSLPGRTYAKGLMEVNQLTIGGVSVGTNFGAGNQYYLDPENGSDANDGKRPDSAFKTFAVAYAALTANQNDTLYYIAGTSGVTLAAAVNWAKDYTHFIGLCAPVPVAQRARIFQLGTLTGASPLVTVSADGCIFKNLYIFQGVDDATSLINVSVTGERNYFENVHFAGGGHATHAINNGASLKIDGGAENAFVGCTIGVDTIGAATGYTALLFDGGARRNTFIDCLVSIEAANAGATFGEVFDATAIDHWNLFKDCIFTNSSSTITLTQSFLIAAVTTGGRLLFKDCMFNRTTKLDDGDRGVAYGNMNAYVAADLGGVSVALHV